MADAKHTPGPWIATFNRNTGVDGVDLSFAIEGRRAYIASGQSAEHLKTDGQDADPILAAECEANGRLISAAPELLSLLQDAVASFGPHIEGGDNEWLKFAEAAIAKATGSAS